MTGEGVGDLPKPVAWVRVWGQVTDAPAHSDDLVVRFRSHSEDWYGHVVRRHIVSTTEFPPDVTKCTAMLKYDENLFTRCTLYAGHLGQHFDNLGHAYLTVEGYIEESE
jgi:hypothetical protein